MIWESILAMVFGSEAFIGWVVAGIAAVFAWIRKRQAFEDRRVQRTFLFLEEGVHEVWEEKVKALKKAREDGKLTAEERKEAFELAKDKAIAYAKAEGWDLLKYIAVQTLPSIIATIVEGRKTKK